MSPVTLVRRVCVGTVAAGITALSLSAPAFAESGELDYSCALFSIDLPGELDPELLEDELTKDLDKGTSLRKAAREAIPQASEASEASGDEATPQSTTSPSGDATATDEPVLPAEPTADEPTTGDTGDDGDEGDGGEGEGPFPDITPIAEDLPLSASFDTAIADGATSPIGKSVYLEPATAQFSLSPELVTELTALSLGNGVGGAFLYGGVAETEQEIGLEFDIDEISLGDGATSLEGTGAFAEDDIAIDGAGTYSYTAGDLDFYFVDEESLAFVGLECTLADGQDATVDQVTALAASPPTPVRPVVVQTDAVQPSSPSWLPVAGAASLLVVGAASVTARRTASARRR